MNTKGKNGIESPVEESRGDALVFISRHKPNDGQVALAREMGYDGIEQKNITFTDNPVEDLKKAGIRETTIALVAPTYVTNKLLNWGYTLIEFVNVPEKRDKMVFVCRGAYKYRLRNLMYEPQEAYEEGQIFQKYYKCPLSVNDQYESSLTPEGSKE